MQEIEFFDSHTAGEPTRVITSGGPDLGDGPLTKQLERLKAEFDNFRRMVILEPRGNEALVGALLCKPHNAACDTGVIFFNNQGYLGMCGHAAMGLAMTLAHLHGDEQKAYHFDTPVGEVEVLLDSPNQLSLRNVSAYRFKHQAAVDVPEIGRLVGDIAWGGNWFFLVDHFPLPLVTDNIPQLIQASRRTLQALQDQGLTGEGGVPIDHIEFFGPPHNADANSCNFVMCPGGAFDRSPCGTGTSAKLACLAAEGRLAPGEIWVQESITGSRFEASYQPAKAGAVLPTIQGNAYLTSQGRLFAHPQDPFRFGMDSGSNG